MISWHTSTELLNQNSGAWVAASGNLTCLSNTQVWHEKQHSPHKSFQIEWALTHTFIHWGAQTIPTSCYTGCREMCHSSPSRSKNAEWQDTWIYASTQCTWRQPENPVKASSTKLHCICPVRLHEPWHHVYERMYLAGASAQFLFLFGQR